MYSEQKKPTQNFALNIGITHSYRKSATYKEGVLFLTGTGKPSGSS